MSGLICGKQRKTYKGQFFLSTMQVLGLKLRLSGVMASIPTH